MEGLEICQVILQIEINPIQINPVQISAVQISAKDVCVDNSENYKKVQL